VRRNQSPKRIQNQNQNPSIVSIVGGMDIAEFCFRRKREERLARELANKDMYFPSCGVPESRLVPRGEGMVRTIYPRERPEFVPRGEPPHREGGRRVGFGW
jgi:hypothetical protein